MPPSALFYNDTLVPASANGKIVWSGLPKPHLPLKFIGTDAVELSNDDRASWFNPGQINIVVEVIKSLLENPRLCDPPLRPGEIAVMAPWRQQVWAMRKRLRDEKYGAVDVGTVEVSCSVLIFWMFRVLCSSEFGRVFMSPFYRMAI
jgi:superfamily I DNA and/or RNA helicase